MCVCVCVCACAARSKLRGASKRSNTHTINGIFVSFFNFVSCSYSILSYVYKTQKMLHTAAFTIDVLYLFNEYLFNISEYKAMLIKLLIYHRKYIFHTYMCMYVCIYVCVYIIYIYIYK